MSTSPHVRPDLADPLAPASPAPSARPPQPRGVRFVRSPRETIGNGQHRSGWPFALACLAPLADPHGILFEDFVEQRFCYHPDPIPLREPWIGVFHHPPDPPPIASSNEHLDHMFQLPAWKASVPFLRGAIALSQRLADYLAATLQVPTAVVKHPTEIPPLGWSASAYRANSYKWLVQVGFYLRNTRAIFQVPPLPRHRKIRLWPPARPPLQWVHEYDLRVARLWTNSTDRRDHGHVTDYPLVTASRYDHLLATQIPFMEVLAASANNVVVECIARRTPLVVNRHPAVVEYLGPDYPLYFDHPHDVPQLLDDDRVIAAHHYLAQLDRRWLDGPAFCDSVRNIVAHWGE